LLFLFVIIGFRGDFDSDYMPYTGIFESVNLDSFTGFLASFKLNVEILYVILMVALKIFLLGPQSVFVACAFLSLWVNWRYCLRVTAYPTLILLGLLSHSFLYREFTEIRHGVAGAICVASFFMISKGQTRRAFTMQIIGAFFHSATLFVIMFSILFCKLPRKKFIYVCTAIGVGMAVIGVHGLLDLMNRLLPLPGSILVYIQSEYDFNLGLMNPTLIKQVLLMAVLLLSVKYLKIKDKLYLDLLTMYYISIIWLVAANEFAMFAGRLASFYGLLDVYLISMTLPYIRNRYLRFMAFLLIVTIYLAQFYLNIEFAKNIFNSDYMFFE